MSNDIPIHPQKTLHSLSSVKALYTLLSLMCKQLILAQAIPGHLILLLAFQLLVIIIFIVACITRFGQLGGVLIN